MGLLRLLLCLAMLRPQAPGGQVRDEPRGTGEISGRITDQVTRQPIPGASVALRAGRESRTANTDADGRYAAASISASSTSNHVSRHPGIARLSRGNLR